MKHYLNSSQVEEYVAKTRYLYDGSQFVSRCSDGSHENIQTLPALALPGGDLGQMVILFAAAKVYGLQFDIERALEELIDIIGGAKKFSFSNIPTHSADICQYLHYLILQPNKFNLLKEELTLLINTLKSKNIVVNTLNVHNSKQNYFNACIIYEGNEGIFPTYRFSSLNGKFDSRIFLVHRTFINQRNHLISKLLYNKKIVKIHEKLDSNYLYEVISEITDEHLFEILNLIDNQIPIFSVKVQKNSISIESLT